MPIVYGNSTLNNDEPVANAVNQTPSRPINFSTPEGSGARESSNSSRGIKCPSDGIGHTCPICKKHTSIKKCTEFRRHIDEHYTRYDCADCNKQYTRKETLDKHRETHSRSDGSSVRDDSSPKSQKRNFACGCCGSYYNSAKEFAKHIHNYFKFRGQLPLWDSNDVIRGLLSSMNPQWSDPNPQSSYSWNSTSGQVQELQNDLEFGLKSPEVLVENAIALRNHGASQNGHIESLGPLVPPGPLITLGQPIQTFNTWSPLSPLPGPQPTPFAPQTSYPSIGALNYHAGHHPQPYTQPESGQGLETQYPSNAFRMQPAGNFAQQSECQAGASYPPSYSGYPQSTSPYAANNLHASQMALGLNGPTPSSTNWYQPSTLASPSSFAPHPDAYNIQKIDTQPSIELHDFD